MSSGPDERDHLFDKPRNVRLVLRVLFAICALVFLIDIADLILHWLGVVDLRHTERSWEGWPGFYPIYGFVACVALVLIAKALRKILMRDEDYYDR